MRETIQRVGLAAAVALLAAGAGAAAAVRLDTMEDVAVHYARADRRLVLAAGLLRARVYWDEVARAARRHGIPEDVFFGLAMCESSFNPLARSPDGAEGMFQFMPRTGRRYGLRNAAERRNVRASTDAAARHLRDLHRRYGNFELALAAYNAGEPAVNQAIAKARSKRWENVRRHLRAETHSFVPKVMYLSDAYYSRFLSAGAQDSTFTTVAVRAGDTFHSLAARLGVSERLLKMINGWTLHANTSILVPIRNELVGLAEGITR